MSEQSFGFTTNGTGDGTGTGYTMAQWIQLCRETLINAPTTQGVILGVGNALIPAGTATPVTIGTGAAWVYGFWYANSAEVEVAVGTPLIGTTGHRIVLRASWAAQTVRITLLSSADGVATIPAVTQTANTTWDISLATLTITTGGVITVTDVRDYVRTNLTPRIPEIYRRQGGSATDWSSMGTTAYTPTNVRTQMGARQWTGSGTTGTLTMTFPIAFSNVPLVFAQIGTTNNGTVAVSWTVSTVTASGFTFTWFSDSTLTSVNMQWCAHGPV